MKEKFGFLFVYTPVDYDRAGGDQMNLLQSDNTYEELIQHMETCGYSPYHIHRVKREMNVERHIVRATNDTL